MNKLLVLFGLTLLFTAANSSATVEDGYLWTVTYQNANVNFYAPDPADSSGCTTLQAQVMVNMSELHTPGPPIAPSVSISLIAAQVDNCTGVLLKFFWLDTVNVTEWKMAESGLATLKAQGQAWDALLSSEQPFVLDLVWTPTVTPFTDSGTQHQRGGGNIFMRIEAQVVTLVDFTSADD